jgi:hypothetical protein
MTQGFGLRHLVPIILGYCNLIAGGFNFQVQQMSSFRYAAMWVA